jgi:hypothetical protein
VQSANGIASIAVLLGSSAIVWVGPPLSPTPFSKGLTLSPFLAEPVERKPQVLSLEML